jgi:integrase
LACIDARLRAAGFRAFQGVPDRALVRAVDSVPDAPWAEVYVNIKAEIRRNASLERKQFATEANAYANACEPQARKLVEDGLKRQGTLDAKGIEEIFAALREDLPREAPAVVGAAKALKRVCKPLIQHGCQIAPPRFFRPSLPQAPYLASGQLAAVGTLDHLRRWLLDPRSWPAPELHDEDSNQRRVARLAMLLLVEGVISDFRRAHQVLAATPTAARWAGSPDHLVCSVRWEDDRAFAEPEAISIGGASAMAALAVTDFLSRRPPSAKQLVQWVGTALKTSPWPVVDQDAMLEGLVRSVALARIFISPGPIAAIAREEIHPREAPPDLMRALVEGCPAEPTPRPDAPEQEGAAPTKVRRLGPSSVGRADRLRSLHELLVSARKRNDPSAVLNWAQTKAADDAEELLARVAARLIWLPGLRVSQYAAGSQKTFLKLVARPLLRQFQGLDLSTIGAEVARAKFIKIWESKSPDRRRAVCLTLAAEVLEETFGIEDVAIDDISAAAGLPKRPRAVFPAPSTWASLSEHREAACSLLESVQSRRAFLTDADLLDAQFHGALRTGELLGLRPKDICRAEDNVWLFVRPTTGRSLKTVQSQRRCALPLASSGGTTLFEFAESTSRRLTALGDNVYPESVDRFTRSAVLQCLACDRRLRPHDLRSLKATTSVFDLVFCRGPDGALELRDGHIEFWSLAAQLGHFHPRTTLQHYVHLFSLWQALLASVDAEALTVPQLASLTARPSSTIEATRRSAGGGRRRVGSLRGLRAQLLARGGFSLAPPPPPPAIAPPAVSSEGARSASGRSEQFVRAISLLCDGASPGKVRQLSGVSRSDLETIAKSMAEFERTFGCRFMPAESAYTLLPSQSPEADNLHRSMRQACPPREALPIVPSRDVAEHNLRLIWASAQRGHPGRLRGLDEAQATALLEADIPVPPRSWRLTCRGLDEGSRTEIERRLRAACARRGAEFVSVAKAPTKGKPRKRHLSVTVDLRRGRGAPRRDDFARWLAGCLTLDRCLADTNDSFQSEGAKTKS